MTGIGTVSASGSTPFPRQEGDRAGTAGCGPRSVAGAGASKAACWGPDAAAGGDGLAACSGLAFIAARMRSSRDSGSSVRDGCVAGQRSFVAPGTRLGSAGTRLSSPMRPKPPGAALTGWRDPPTHSAAHVESLFNPNDRLLFNCVTSSGTSISRSGYRRRPPPRPRLCLYQRRKPGRPEAGAPWADRSVLERRWPSRHERSANGRSPMTAPQRCPDSATEELLVPLRSSGRMGRQVIAGREVGRAGCMGVAGRGLVRSGNFGKHPSFGGQGTVPFVCAVVACGSRVPGAAVRI
jgi:hypothetical protein